MLPWWVPLGMDLVPAFGGQMRSGRDNLLQRLPPYMLDQLHADIDQLCQYPQMPSTLLDCP